MAAPFDPIYTGSFSQASYDVAERLAHVSTLAELTARLGALPVDALKSAVLSEPEVYKGMIGEARDLAAYLRLHADAFSELARRLEGVAG